MKKLLSITLTVITAATAVLCGCNNGAGTPNNSLSSFSGASTGDSAEASGVQVTTLPPPTDSPVKTTGNKIHVNDYTLGDIWISELDGVNVNKLDKSNFTADASFKYYSENGKPASLEGIDISSYNGDIDWKKVKASGVDFVMVRVGGRGYGSEGSMYSDDRAVEYIREAQKVGIKAGAYFFSQATTNAEAEEEALYVKEILGDIKLEFPVAYDWEIIKDDDARTDMVTSTQATECAAAFCEKIKELGYTPMFYSSSRELYFKYDLTRLKDYNIWYVEYSDVPDFYYEFSMWQYSETGNVDGIEGNVDLNICFTNIADYAR